MKADEIVAAFKAGKKIKLGILTGAEFKSLITELSLIASHPSKVMFT